MSSLADGQIGLKLYNGHTWSWYYFQISQSDAKRIHGLSQTRKMLSPVVDKVRGRYRIRFAFSESKALVSDENRLAYADSAILCTRSAGECTIWCLFFNTLTTQGSIFSTSD